MVTATLRVPGPAWEARLAAHPLPGAALFGSRTIAEVLGTARLRPDRPWGARDIVFQLGTNIESTQRAMERLRQAAVVAEARRGRRRDVVMPRGPRTTSLRQGAPGRDGVGVVGAEDALADGEGTLEERAGSGRPELTTAAASVRPSRCRTLATVPPKPRTTVGLVGMSPGS